MSLNRVQILNRINSYLYGLFEVYLVLLFLLTLFELFFVFSHDSPIYQPLSSVYRSRSVRSYADKQSPGVSREGRTVRFVRFVDPSRENWVS